MTHLKGFRAAPTSVTPTTASVTNAPWAAATPYLQQSYEQAAKLYAQGPEQYTPFSQVAGLTPYQLAAIKNTSDYVNSNGTHDFMNSATNAATALRTDANNPYKDITRITNPALAGFLSNNSLADVSGGLNRFMYQNTGDKSLQDNIFRGQTQAGSATGGVNSLVQNRFGIGKNIAENLDSSAKTNAVNSAFSQGFDMQNVNRLKAIGMADSFNNGRMGLASNLLQNQGNYTNNSIDMGYGAYGTTMGAPLSMLQKLGAAGGVRQDQNQAQIKDATARWDQGQNARLQALQRYAAAINPNTGWGNTYTADNNMTQQAGTDNTAMYLAAGTQLAGLGVDAYNSRR